MNKEKVSCKQKELCQLLKYEKQRNFYIRIARWGIIAAGTIVLILANKYWAIPLSVKSCISISAMVFVIMDLITEEIKRSIDYKYTKRELLHKIQVEYKNVD